MDEHIKFSEDVVYEAYSKHLRGEYFERVRAIILVDNKVVYIRDSGNGRVSLPGGCIHPNETLEQAVVRETFHDTGYKVKPIKLVGKDFYDVKMRIGEIPFVSKRVVYAYLCEIIEETFDHKVPEGRYEDEPVIFLDAITDLLDCKIGQETIDRIKYYIKHNKK